MGPNMDATASRYEAVAWPSSILGIKPSATVEVTWDAEATKLRDMILQRLQYARDTLDGRIPTDLWWTTGYREPMKHQAQAVQAIRYHQGSTLLADDMGLGKTSSALWALQATSSMTALIVCPVSVKHNWRHEIETTLGKFWNVVVIEGTRGHRATQFTELRDQANDARTAVVINYDLLLQLTDSQLDELKDLLARGNTEGGVLICDESHALKNRKAQRTKIVQSLRKHAGSVLLLTGTPVRNTVEDLYTQVELVRPGTWSNFSDFEKRYLQIARVDFGKRAVRRVVGSKNLNELNAIVNTLQIRRKKEDVLDLPPKIHTFPELELDGVMLDIYKQMKDFAVLKLSELRGQGVTVFDPRARSGVEAAMRCEQIAQGFAGGVPEPLMQSFSKAAMKSAEKIPGRPNELVFPNSPKIKWVLETIEDVRAQGGAPVVFSRFNAPLVWLYHFLQSDAKTRVSFLHGGLSSQTKPPEINKFSNGETEVFLCQVRMAEGFNLTRSQDVLFFGRDWSPAVNSQAEDRCHRIGQRGTVNIQVPLVSGTIETAIHKKLAAKGSNAEQALRSMTIEEFMEML